MARGLTQREVGLVVAGLGVGVSGGFALGFKLGQEKILSIMDETLERELEGMRAYYVEQQVKLAEQPKPDPEELVARYGTPAPAAPVIVVEEVHPVSIFEPEEEVEPGPEVWSYELELAQRSADVPYVIHVDEFSQPPGDHDSMRVTWFEGDDTLIDERSIPIDDQDTLVGLDNLEKFGHGSDSPHIVFVRNEALKLDIEVTKSSGTLAEAMGISPPPEEDGELRHSSDRRSFDDER
jgi:hypothetical protein